MVADVEGAVVSRQQHPLSQAGWTTGSPAPTAVTVAEAARGQPTYLMGKLNKNKQKKR